MSGLYSLIDEIGMKKLKKKECIYIFLVFVFLITFFIIIMNGADNGETAVTTGKNAPENSAGINETIKELVIIKDKTDYTRDEIIAMLESDFRKKVSVSEDLDHDSLAENIYLEINDIVPSMSGAGVSPVFYNITIEQLPNNPAITMPGYLGRDYGLVINIECSEQAGKITDTVWWYTCDATRIAKAIFDSKTGSRVGVLGIVFSEPQKGREISFVLYSADAEQLRPFWKEEGSCIRVSDWSSVDTGMTNLVMYESPYLSVDIEPGLIKDTYPDFLADNTNIDSLIAESSNEILLLFDEMNRVVDQKNYDGIVSSSEVLLSKCLKEKEKFSGMLSCNLNSNPLKQYIRALDLFSSAGSGYWYGAVYLDKDGISEGNRYFVEGTEVLGQLTGSSGESFILKEQLPEIITSSIVNSRNLNTPVHYRDPTGCNDISIDTDGYKLASNLYIKDGTAIRQVKSHYGSIFVAVVVDIYHLGYRGGGTEVITTPSRNDFVLIYDGIEYKDITPDNYIRNLGEVYKQKKLNRLEHYEANLVYEIDYDGEFNPDLASLKVNLGNEWGEHLWRFEDS